MKAGVVVFPGSNCDQDCFHVAREVMGMETLDLWHKDARIDSDIQLIILPGGFTYGDYLRETGYALKKLGGQIQWQCYSDPVIGPS